MYSATFCHFLPLLSLLPNICHFLPLFATFCNFLTLLPLMLPLQLFAVFAIFFHFLSQFVTFCHFCHFLPLLQVFATFWRGHRQTDTHTRLALYIDHMSIGLICRGHSIIIFAKLYIFFCQNTQH